MERTLPARNFGAIINMLNMQGVPSSREILHFSPIPDQHELDHLLGS
jgi:hypothetical protein